MSLRAIPSFSLGYLVLRRGISIPLRICGSGVHGIPPVRWGARWFRVRPVPSELGRGRLSRFSVLHGGWMFGLVRRVFRKRPQGVTRTLSAAKQGGAERPGDGCPCV